jgi:putative restriction endonuclease
MDNHNFQTIKIENNEYLIIDSLQNLRAEDSFISKKNKLAQFKGNGESKKYVGSYSGEKADALKEFFNYKNWGIEYIDLEKNRKTFTKAETVGAAIQKNNCFFSKSNLMKYLHDSKTEYLMKEQTYKFNISEFYQVRLNDIENLASEYSYFSIYDASDNLSESQNRAYIRSDDAIWKIWRELILPKISYLSILKLQPIDGNSKTVFYYFQIFIDYQFRSIIHPSILKEFSEELQIESSIKKSYRIGSEKYRRQVIDHMIHCPFSLISDERLLIASHIKPHSICMKEGRLDQAIDHFNGLALSPTYDKLFDQGYITFSNKGELICATLLSPMTWSRLNINPSIHKIMNIRPENREQYLEYHRKNVFQGIANELI